MFQNTLVTVNEKKNVLAVYKCFIFFLLPPIFWSIARNKIIG